MNPQPVECVEGCGDPVLALASIVIAGASVCVALAALYATRKQYEMAKAEHSVFMERLGARADFRLDIWITHHEVVEGVIETTADRIGVMLQLGIKNTGTKAASNVGVNLLAPTTADIFLWTDQRGHDLPERARASGPLSTAEELVAEDGTRHPAHYLTRIYDEVGMKGDLVAFAKLSVPMLQTPGSEVVMPIKLKAWTDDLPDDVDERTKEIEFRLRRVAR